MGNKQQNNDKYHALRKVGYTAAEANQLKWRSWDYIKELVETKRATNCVIQKVIDRQEAQRKKKRD